MITFKFNNTCKMHDKLLTKVSDDFKEYFNII